MELPEIERRRSTPRRGAVAVYAPNQLSNDLLFIGGSVVIAALLILVPVILSLLQTPEPERIDDSFFRAQLKVDHALQVSSLVPRSKGDAWAVTELTEAERFIARLISQTQPGLRNAGELARSIVVVSREQGVDPMLVAAVIHAESTFRHSVRSNKGAVGLMQLLPSTARYISGKRQLAFSEAELEDPKTNIRLGIEYLRYLLEMFDGDLRHVLIAYNWGPGNLLEAIKERSPIPSGPAQYANKIISNQKRWRERHELQLAELSSGGKAVG